ncbi:MAG: hypothetical protein K9K78_07530 [Spirochaetales bacterium]|nr:hypothetical protein [Spirochaetales bacterium]
MEQPKLIIKTGCTHTHFTWGERLLLQYHYSGTNKLTIFISLTSWKLKIEEKRSIYLAGNRPLSNLQALYDAHVLKEV